MYIILPPQPSVVYAVGGMGAKMIAILDRKADIYLSIPWRSHSTWFISFHSASYIIVHSLNRITLPSFIIFLGIPVLEKLFF